MNLKYMNLDYNLQVKQKKPQTYVNRRINV